MIVEILSDVNLGPDVRMSEVSNVELWTSGRGAASRTSSGLGMAARESERRARKIKTFILFEAGRVLTVSLPLSGYLY